MVVQCDGLNRTRIATVLCVPLTSNLKWADAHGNVVLRAAATGLDRDSIANVSLTFAVDKGQFIECVGRLEQRLIDRILAGIDVILGR